MKKRYCVATKNSYVSSSEGQLQWTYDLDEAINIAQSVNGAVYDAEAFAFDPVPANHKPLYNCHV